MSQIEVEPDWRKLYTAAQAESEFTDFKFKGPGWYFGKMGDAMLVYPEGDLPLPFHQRTPWSPEQQFWFLVYNGRDPSRSFSEVFSAPVRDDGRAG